MILLQSLIDDKTESLASIEEKLDRLLARDAGRPRSGDF